MSDTYEAGNLLGMEVYAVRTRLIGVLAAGAVLLGVATAGAPNVSAATGATCTLVSSKVVGSRSYNYAVKVRMSNLTSIYSRITTTLADRDGKTYRIGASVASKTTVSVTKLISAPPGTTFRVVACSQR